MSGWISIERAIQKHWVFKDPEALKLWITMLLDTNHGRNAVVFGKTLVRVDRGQLVFGRGTYSYKTGISEMKIRRHMRHFEADQMITVETFNKFSIVTILAYDRYQKTGFSEPGHGDKKTDMDQQLAESASGKTTGYQPAKQPGKQPGMEQKNNQQKQEETSEKSIASDDMFGDDNRVVSEKITGQTTGEITTPNKYNNNKDSTRFKKPTMQQLVEAFTGRVDDPQTQSELFINHYESVDWHVGKKRMKSWPHAVNNWVIRIRLRQPPQRKDEVLSL